MAAVRWLALCAFVALGSCQEADNAGIQTRAIESTPDQNSDSKFKVYVGTIDGVRREIFNEVQGGEDNVPTGDSGNPVDPFGAYDDNNIITTENEKNLFVPRPYRPDKKEEKKTTTTTTTTTTPRPTLPPTIRTVPPPPPTRPPQPQPIAPVQPQPVFRPAPIAPQTLPPPPPPTAPPRVVTQAPFVPPVAQPRPQFTQPPFQPQPQQFTQTPFQPQPQPTRAPFRPEPLPEVRQPQVPQFNRPPQFTRPAPVRPPTPPPTTPAPQLPFANTQNLRTGVCSASIFYISTPITGPTRLSFTHFAIAVTVDQCARTCHEFNCAIAHYNPVNGHCEFNPSTAFAIRNGQCPAWPSLHYRNNVVASEPVRIFCVQCQRPRRRQNRIRTNSFGRNRNFEQRTRGRGGFRSRSQINGKRSLEHPIIHGMLVSQPRAVALGVTQQQFLTAIEPSGSQLRSSIAVNVSPVEVEENNDASLEHGVKRKIQGVTQFEREDQIEALRELENLHI